MLSIGNQGHGPVDRSGSDLYDHHYGGKRYDKPCSPLVAVVIMAKVNVVMFCRLGYAQISHFK